jgi:DNA-binding NtrC family response regulator
MSTSLPPKPCSGLRIVVVDDEETFRTALAENLRDDGHPVHDAADPLAVGTLDGIDVVITDYEMDTMNGIAFADLVHFARPGVEVVLITAYCSPDLTAAIAERPFVRLHHKPVDYDALHAQLHACAAAARA